MKTPHLRAADTSPILRTNRVAILTVPDASSSMDSRRSAFIPFRVIPFSRCSFLVHRGNAVLTLRRRRTLGEILISINCTKTKQFTLLLYFMLRKMFFDTSLWILIYYRHLALCDKIWSLSHYQSSKRSGPGSILREIRPKTSRLRCQTKFFALNSLLLNGSPFVLFGCYTIHSLYYI